MDTVRAFLTARADDNRVAIGAPAAGEKVYTYDRLCETAAGAANVLAEVGVGPDSFVAIAPERSAETAIAFLASASLGATVWFGGPGRVPVDAVVAPTPIVAEYTAPPGAGLIGFGAKPEHDDVIHFERAAWSAADDLPDVTATPAMRVLTDGEVEYTQRKLLDVADAIAEERAFEEDLSVVTRASLTDPRAVVAGILAPLVGGATVRNPGSGDAGDVAVTDGAAAETRVILLRDVDLA